MKPLFCTLLFVFLIGGVWLISRRMEPVEPSVTADTIARDIDATIGPPAFPASGSWASEDIVPAKAGQTKKLDVVQGTPEKLKLDELFPTDRVMGVQIEVVESDWDTLRFQRRHLERELSADRRTKEIERPYTWVPANVTIDGVSLGTVGIRKKGFMGSQSEERPGLKVKLDFLNKKANIDGLEVLTLNNNKQDRSLAAQFMGYAFFNAAGVPAPRVGFAQVMVNGRNLGVYSHVETVREQMLERAYGSRKGTLFEATVTDFYKDWEGSFQKKTGSNKKGRAAIVKLINALEGTSQPIFDSSVSTRAIVPTDGELGTAWVASDFDDSKWAAGTNGAGFEKGTGYEPHIDQAFNFANSLSATTPCIYMRYTFELGDLAAITSGGRLLLRMKYDDGFVAYLNGERIASANAPADSVWNSTATASHEDPAAMRFLPFDITEHADKLCVGRNVIAVHAMNVSVQSTDMLIAANLELNNHDYVAAIGDACDLDAFYRFWAVEGLLGFWDGYSGNRNNFFVYRHPKTDKIHFLPWGGDCLFEKFSRLPFNQNAPLSVKTKGRVAYQLYQIPECRERYHATLLKIMEQHWDEDKLLAELDRVEAMLDPFISENQRYKVDSEPMRAFIRSRRRDLEPEINSKMPVWTAAPGPPPAIPPGTKPRGRRARRR